MNVCLIILLPRYVLVLIELLDPQTHSLLLYMKIQTLIYAEDAFYFCTQTLEKSHWLCRGFCKYCLFSDYLNMPHLMNRDCGLEHIA